MILKNRPFCNQIWTKNTNNVRQLSHGHKFLTTLLQNGLLRIQFAFKRHVCKGKCISNLFATGDLCVQSFKGFPRPSRSR